MADRNPIRAFSFSMISLKAKSILGFIKKLSIVFLSVHVRFRDRLCVWYYVRKKTNVMG